MRRVSRQNDDAAGRIGLQLVGIEPIAETDVEHSRHYCVHAILRVAMRHEFHVMGNPDPNCVRTGLRRMAHDDCQTDRRWKRRERLPLEIFGQRYPIRSALDVEYIKRLATYVDGKIRAASDSAPSARPVASPLVPR